MQFDSKNQKCSATVEDESCYGLVDPLPWSAEYTNTACLHNVFFPIYNSPAELWYPVWQQTSANSAFTPQCFTNSNETAYNSRRDYISTKIEENICPTLSLPQYAGDFITDNLFQLTDEVRVLRGQEVLPYTEATVPNPLAYESSDVPSVQCLYSTLPEDPTIRYPHSTQLRSTTTYQPQYHNPKRDFQADDAQLDQPHVKRRKRRGCSDNDFLIIQLKEQGHLSWRDIQDSFRIQTGKEYSIPRLQMRLKRLKDRLKM